MTTESMAGTIPKCRAFQSHVETSSEGGGCEVRSQGNIRDGIFLLSVDDFGGGRMGDGAGSEFVVPVWFE